MPSKEKDKTEETKKQDSPIVINQSFFSLTDRSKRLVIADMMQWASSQIAVLEGVNINPEKK